MDAYLEFAEITGSSTADDFLDHHDILSFSHSASRPANMEGGRGRDPGHVAHSVLSVTKMVDKATPLLWDFCNANKAAPEIILKLVRIEGAESSSEGGERSIFMIYTLKNVRITSINVSGGGGGMAVENITFAYEQILWTYNGEDGNVESGWDVPGQTGL